MNHAVVLENVQRRFRSVHAVRDLSLTLAPGEVLGLLGHNGAGKSTTLKLILGVLAPDAGRVLLLGENPRGRHAYRLRLELGYLPENVSFYDNLTGREVLHYFARLKRVAVREVDALLERVGLAHAADRRVRTYSRGMRQRLGLAQALLRRPRLLLLDEPTAGLDPMATRDVYDMLATLRGQGTGVILCSHVLAGMERYVDRVAILCEGRLLAAGTIDELRARAGLLLRIHARGHGLNGALLAKLAGSDTGLEIATDDSIVITVAPAEKLAVLRALLDVPGVQDVSIEPPGLEKLYAHFDQHARHGGQA